MFGMGRRMSNQEKEEMYKKELKSLESDERMYKLRDEVYTKKKKVKELKTKPIKDRFSKFASSLQQIKKNKRPSGSIFGDSTPNTAFSGGVFNTSTKSEKKPMRMKYKEVYYK